MNDSPESKFEQAFGEDLVQKSSVHINLKQDVIITTEDKLRLCLGSAISKLTLRRGWWMPVSILLTIALVFATTTFHETFSIPPATWEAIFLLCGAGCGIWTIVAIFKAVRANASVDSIVDELKLKTKELKKRDA